MWNASAEYTIPLDLIHSNVGIAMYTKSCMYTYGPSICIWDIMLSHTHMGYDYPVHIWDIPYTYGPIDAYWAEQRHTIMTIDCGFGSVNISRFLNQACAGHRPSHIWFLKIVSVRTSVCVSVCMCPHPRGY